MPVFKIIVSREIVEETFIQVEADTPDQAMDKARSPEALAEAEWVVSDYMGDNDYYIYAVE